MKKILLILLAIIPTIAMAQTLPFDTMKSYEGQLIKYKDIRIEPVKLAITPYIIVANVRYSYDENKYYFCLQQTKDKFTHTETISYQTLIELNKVIKILIEQSQSELSSDDLIRNYYQSTDGFIVGYEVQGGEIRWYIDFCDKTYNDKKFILSGHQIAAVFAIAQKKIEELTK